jgi:RNase P/RNase MRP subunit p29
MKIKIGEKVRVLENYDELECEGLTGTVVEVEKHTITVQFDSVSITLLENKKQSICLHSGRGTIISGKCWCVPPSILQRLVDEIPAELVIVRQRFEEIKKVSLKTIANIEGGGK